MPSFVPCVLVTPGLLPLSRGCSPGHWLLRSTGDWRQSILGTATNFGYLALLVFLCSHGLATAPLGIIQGTDGILDGTTQRIWFHDDAEAARVFPNPGKGRSGATKSIPCSAVGRSCLFCFSLRQQPTGVDCR